MSTDPRLAAGHRHHLFRWRSSGTGDAGRPVGGQHPARAEASAGVSRERWMGLSFAAGSLCFMIAPFPGYAQWLGAEAAAVTFFAGSLAFTCGGALQVWLSLRGRSSSGSGRAAWWAAVIQSAGTLFFNATTFRALHTALSNPDYDRLVWRPDALGSVCFLVSGVIAYRASARRGWLPARGGRGWWE